LLLNAGWQEAPVAPVVIPLGAQEAFLMCDILVNVLRSETYARQGGMPE